LPTYSPSPDEVGAPASWLYVSKRLVLEWLPNDVGPMWWGPVISLNGVAFYRLSARMVNWLEKAGEQLQCKFEVGQVARDQLTEYADLMVTVWAFAGEHLSGEAVKVARVQVPTLPDVDGPK
jgi:hypothetical protein